MRPPPLQQQQQQQAAAAGPHPGSPYARAPGGGPGPGAAGEPMQTNNFETTFDVDGHVETKEALLAMQGGSDARPGYQADMMLPATLEFREDGE